MPIPHLDDLAELPPLPDGRAISRLMHLIWLTRPDLQQSFDLKTGAGRLNFITWFIAAATKEYRIPPLVPRVGRPVITPSNTFYRRKQLSDRAAKLTGCIPIGIRRRSARLWLALALKLGALRGWRAQVPENDPAPGINVIGYADAVLSLGEHMRMTAQAFASVDTAAGICDFGLGTRNRQQESTTILPRLKSNRYSVNLLHINADQMVQAYCHFGPAFFQSRYNIGCWAWELSRFPESWTPVTELVDEIWAPSRFVQEAIQEVTDRPVILMPQCVELPSFPEKDRAAFDLPHDTWLFLLTFDFLSFIDRKNPWALIRAFKLAFPDGREQVGLVLKVMNGDERDPKWRRMIDEIDADHRIFVINERMSRADSLALMASCDSFVSLHRSEGFGRGLAEAMALGKPVIATAYSGNMDFMTADNSYLVDFELVPVEPDQYVHGEGQVWAEASVEKAASQMRAVMYERRHAAEIGLRGRRFVQEHLSAEMIGRKMTDRLEALGLI